MSSELITASAERIEHRLSSFREITGLVFHNLNNLMSGIYGMAQLAQATSNPEYSDKTVEMAVQNCREIKRIVEQISLYSSRLESGAGIVAVQQLVETVLVLLSREIEKKELEISVEVEEQLSASQPADVQEMVYYLCREIIDTAAAKSPVTVCSGSSSEILLMIIGPQRASDSNENGFLAVAEKLSKETGIEFTCKNNGAGNDRTICIMQPAEGGVN